MTVPAKLRSDSIMTVIRPMHFNLFMMDTGHHEASWRLPGSYPLAQIHIEYFERMAQRGGVGDVRFVLPGRYAGAPGRIRTAAGRPDRAADAADRDRPRHPPDRPD